MHPVTAKDHQSQPVLLYIINAENNQKTAKQGHFNNIIHRIKIQGLQILFSPLQQVYPFSYTHLFVLILVLSMSQIIAECHLQ